MIEIIKGFAFVFLGVFFVYIGSFQIIMNMLPHDLAMRVSEIHGKWVRQNVLHLPDIKEEK